VALLHRRYVKCSLSGGIGEGDGRAMGMRVDSRMEDQNIGKLGDQG
jgi:hypothetical protein